MKKSNIILLHISFWVCYFILVLIIIGIFMQGQNDPNIFLAFQAITLFAIIPSLIAFYGYYFLLFKYILKHKTYLTPILYGLGISMAAACISVFLNQNTFQVDCSDEQNDDIVDIFIFMTAVASVSGIVGLIIHGFIQWFGDLKTKEDLLQKNHQMELALVKSQLDPHFLFNTLNNIDILILKDADKASSYLNQLSDIMRFMLFETKTDNIPLSKEIQYIEKYIELQKIRTSNKNYVHLNIEGDSTGQYIAPMIFIPFIENAFKHSINKKTEHAITIDICILKHSISLVCSNKYDPKRKLNSDHAHGLGNELIEKRLALIYQNKYTLNINKQDNTYIVNLNIDNE